ncbi:MAG: hypothetical protein J7518_15040 [Nocardioidaceae bacterium]|nr:hypothetical protein [Nocardioidaceae bacterium]
MAILRKTLHIRRNVVLVSVLAILIAGSVVAITDAFKSPPAEADVTFTQNVQAVGVTRYAKSWTNYGPPVIYTFCGGRTGCTSVFGYWRVSRGTATTRVTTFKVMEKIRAYDFYLLDVDVTTSSRTGTGDGGPSAFRIHSAGPSVFDRNDSRSIDSQSSGCTTVGVTMSTPWPVVGASATVGHASLCGDHGDLIRSYSGGDAVYRGTHLDDVRHLTMQRWVQVAAGKKPSFGINVVLPLDSCTRGDGKGHCIKFSEGSTSRSIAIGTTG